MGQWTSVSHIKNGIPQIDLSNEVLCMSNKDRMPKLRPREVDVPIYRNEAHIFGASSPRVRFFMFRVFHCFSIVNRPSSLIVTWFIGL